MSFAAFVDLDDTLVTTWEGVVHVRPGAGNFLRALSGHAPVFILSHATTAHIGKCLNLIPEADAAIAGVFSRENLEPIEAVVAEVMGNLPFLTKEKEQELKMKISPIAPPGVVFDDQPVGSYYYALKSSAVGAGRRLWIKVDPYLKPDPSDDGLERAYAKFQSRFVRPLLSGRLGGSRLGAVEGWTVTHDGETLKTGFASDFEATAWLHQRHSFSVDHAVRYEGYDVVLVREGRVEYSAKQEQIKERKKRSPEELAEEFEQAVRQAFIDVFGEPKRPETVERAIRSSYLEPGRKQKWTDPKHNVVLVGTEYSWFEDMFSGPDWNRWEDVTDLLDARGWRKAWFDSINPAVHVVYWEPEKVA